MALAADEHVAPSVGGDGLDLFRFPLPDFAGPINEQRPVQVIHLVLEDARQPTFRFDPNRFAAPI
jgi:hypothetical protein